MFRNKNRSQFGYTLIELLVVIAIIALLSSIISASVSKTRARARDAKRIGDLTQLAKAMQLYYEQAGKMPSNYYCSNSASVWTQGVVCANGTGDWGAWDYGGYYNPRIPQEQAWDMSMQELVVAGVIGSVPHPPKPSPDYGGYGYYDYYLNGQNPNPLVKNIGALLVTHLETDSPDLTGRQPSCRPFTAQNWCSSDTPNNSYCLCVSY